MVCAKNLLGCIARTVSQLMLEGEEVNIADIKKNKKGTYQTPPFRSLQLAWTFCQNPWPICPSTPRSRCLSLPSLLAHDGCHYVRRLLYHLAGSLPSQRNWWSWSSTARYSFYQQYLPEESIWEKPLLRDLLYWLDLLWIVSISTLALFLPGFSWTPRYQNFAAISSFRPVTFCTLYLYPYWS